MVFQLVNLPVEFDASRRARQALLTTGLVSVEEDRTVAKVLNAAAWTYVAATLTSVLILLSYLYRFGFLGGQQPRRVTPSAHRLAGRSAMPSLAEPSPRHLER